MVRPPNAEQLKEIARGFKLNLDDEETGAFLGLMGGRSPRTTG